ncbi:MAG: hypothetical protein C5B60_08825 [Chloroflexi bacterium]|nr:MAG: hypothetical protein C5B60_08825 [Chloroflexota bacterium]
MKISLAAPSYTAYSVVAAAQQTMNLIPAAVEVPNEGTRLVLYGRPGLQYFATVTPANIRCLWSGGGRLFVIHGGNEDEIHSNGTLTTWGTVAQGTQAPDPAFIASNGTQLLIVSGGKVYCDNGSGAQPANFAITGTGNTFASNSTLIDSGQYQTPPVAGPFLPAWQGKNILIAGIPYVMSGVPNDHTIVLGSVPPNLTGATWETAQGAQVDGVWGAYIDGYFVVNRVAAGQQTGRQFNISALNDGTRWSTLDFAIKEGAPDNINSVLADHEQLWLFGTDTIEIWADVGASPFPFQRIDGAMIRDGSVATWAPCSVGLSVCYLAGGHAGETIAYRAQGLQPQRISTHAQESEWNQAGYRVWDATSYGYSEQGHIFWVVNFWQQQRTWVYDLTEGLWHERAAWNPAGSNYLRYQPWFHAFVPEWGQNGMHIVGDPATGILYQQSLNFTDDNGNVVQYTRAFPHLINENQWHYDHQFELLMEQGIQTPAQFVPTIGLDWSDDHAHTWKENISRLKSAAPSGNYTQRLIFRRLGKSRDRIYRIGITARTKVALIDAYLEATQGFA